MGQANRGIDAILITDGSDNCKMDTCASAKALKQAIPGLRMHVIGFDPKPSQELKAMACVAEASGGQFHDCLRRKRVEEGPDRRARHRRDAAAPARAGATGRCRAGRASRTTSSFTAG